MMKNIELEMHVEFNKVFEKYDDLIRHFQQFSKEYYDMLDMYYEKHHIKPRCEGGSDKDGIVLLPLRYHALAHFLRCKEAYAANDFNAAYRNINACRLIMCAAKGNLGWDMTATEFWKKTIALYKEFGTFVTNGEKSQRLPNSKVDEWLKEHPGWRKGRVFKSPIGKIWITNGVERTYLLKEEAEKFLATHEGWYKGMGSTNFNYAKRGSYATTTGMKWAHKGDKRINVPKDELEKYLSEGWVLGSGNSKTNLNKIRIHKGNELINVPKTELEKYLALGYEVGTSEAYKQHCKEAQAKRRKREQNEKLK